MDTHNHMPLEASPGWPEASRPHTQGDPRGRPVSRGTQPRLLIPVCARGRPFSVETQGAPGPVQGPRPPSAAWLQGPPSPCSPARCAPEGWGGGPLSSECPREPMLTPPCRPLSRDSPASRPRAEVPSGVLRTPASVPRTVRGRAGGRLALRRGLDQAALVMALQTRPGRPRPRQPLR